MKHKKRQKNLVNQIQKSNNIVLTAKTDKQKEYLTALKSASQVFAVGPAGTGKTFLPTMYAAKMYLEGKVNKIVITRPAVTAGGEQHGFLPGDLNKKMANWVIPIAELIEECVGKEMFLEMMRTGDLEIAPFAYMRGRTFQNAFMIVDEGQNISIPQMEMLLTRIGEDCKLVIAGDIKQSDLDNTSGLGEAIYLADKHKLPVKVVRFTSADVVRSGMTKLWVEAFEKG